MQYPTTGTGGLKNESSMKDYVKCIFNLQMLKGLGHTPNYKLDTIRSASKPGQLVHVHYLD